MDRSWMSIKNYLDPKYLDGVNEPKYLGGELNETQVCVKLQNRMHSSLHQPANLMYNKQ